MYVLLDAVRLLDAVSLLDTLQYYLSSWKDEYLHASRKNLASFMNSLLQR